MALFFRAIFAFVSGFFLLFLFVGRFLWHPILILMRLFTLLVGVGLFLGLLMEGGKRLPKLLEPKNKT